MTEIVYSQTRHPLCEGRQRLNPRFFAGVQEGASAVFVVGDFPKIVDAYTAAGVLVTVEGGALPPKPLPAAPASLTPVSDEPGTIAIPDDWRSLPYTGKSHALTLRQLAALVSDEPVLTKVQAIAVIEAELERRAADVQPEPEAGE